MKSLRIIAFVLLVVASVSIAWTSGYRMGDNDASDRESKVWEALIASGRLNGITDGMHRWAGSVSITQAGYIADDYEREYERFLEARAKVPDHSNANWLMDNHVNGKMKPDEFRSILLKYQNQAEQGGADQPATVPQSKPSDISTPNTESKPRPQ